MAIKRLLVAISILLIVAASLTFVITAAASVGQVQVRQPTASSGIARPVRMTAVLPREYGYGRTDTAGSTNAVIAGTNCPVPQLAPGSLDPSFSGDGVATSSGSAYAVSAQADGRIVVAGTYSSVFLVERYNADGSRDASFKGGRAYAFIGYSLAVAESVLIQPDGRVVAAGWVDDGSNIDVGVARFNIDGSLDTTFDGDGMVMVDVSAVDIGKAIALQSDGKIVVAGTVPSATNDFALMRFNTDGSLDTTFDGDGMVTTDFGADDIGRSLAIQGDGKIILVGTSSSGGIGDFALARYLPDGSLDTAFDGDGKETSDFGNNEWGESVALQRDGKIVVAGSTSDTNDSSYAMARYNSDGGLDSTFDNDGITVTDVTPHFSGDKPAAVAVQSDGRILVAGATLNLPPTAEDFVLIRYEVDGSLDATFGSDGIVTTDFGGYDRGRAMAIQLDGRIVVAGSSGVRVALARYLASPPVFHVDASATGANNGSSWQDALTSLDDALAHALHGEEIWVARGVYTPTRLSDPSNPRSATFALPDGVAVYGGFAGTETCLNQRDWMANPTVLSGDIGGDDLTDASGVVTSTANISGANAYHVVTAGSWLTETAYLDGFVITGGQADATSAVPCDRDCGGGVYNPGGTLVLASSRFMGNTAGVGGAIHNGGELSLTSSAASGNSASGATGGGAIANNGALTLTNVTLYGNVASNYGGALYSGGDLWLANAILWGNGAITGTQLYASGVPTPTITYSDIEGSGGSGPGWDSSLGNDGGGNIDQDPLFLAAATGDLHLGLTSPAIDAGDNSALPPDIFDLDVDVDTSEPHPFDLDSRPRFMEVITATNTGSGTPPIVDMGAFEAGEQPIGGLAASSDGPTPLGQTTAFTATISAGTNVSYQWGFGDGNIGAGPYPSHTYAAVGTYTATVTATNPVGSQSATTVVLVEQTIAGLTAYNDSPTPIGQPTTFSTTLASGTGVTYQWDFGDGSFGTGISPSHTYPFVGQYTVTVTASNAVSSLSAVTRVDIVCDAGNLSARSDFRSHAHGVVSTPNVADSMTWFVSKGAIGANNGSSWQDAFTDLRNALSCALAGDEIWVAGGIYTPTDKADPADPRSASFSMRSGTALYGGFSGTESSRDQRDWSANPTILSGDLDRNDITDALGIVTTTKHIFGANAYHVVSFNSTVTQTAEINGFIITAGQADGQGFGLCGDTCGGGVFNAAGTLFTSNNHFIGNAAKYYGAIYNGGTLSVEYSDLAGNAAAYGGAIYSLGTLSISDSRFVSNTATANGGAVFSSGTLTATNDSFIGNKAGQGGGIDSYGELSINSSSFISNTASGRGGGIFIGTGRKYVQSSKFEGNAAGWGGAISGWGELVVANSSFARNLATRGGAIELDTSSLYSVVQGCDFIGNGADYGGGISVRGRLYVSNSKLSGNTATNDGGGILSLGGIDRLTAINSSISGNTASYGGGIFVDGELALFNSTLAENFAVNNGGGVFVGTGGLWQTVTLGNTILWDNVAAAEAQLSRAHMWFTPTISYSTIQDSGGSGAGWDTSLGADGGGNVDTNPLFVRDPDPGDGDWSTPADNDYGDLRLQIASPAVDAGDNGAVPADVFDLDNDGNVSEPLPFDLDGAARFFDIDTVSDSGAGTPPIVDMGAFERQPEAIGGLATANDGPTALGQPTSFTADVTTGTGVSYAWDFGDGDFGNGASPIHLYQAAGRYTVTVTATNSINSLTATTEVIVQEAITGLSAGNDSPTTLGQPTSFTTTLAGGSDVSYVWDFDDGQGGTGPAPSHTFTTTGMYTVTVTASNLVSSMTATTSVEVKQYTLFLPIVIR